MCSHSEQGTNRLRAPASIAYLDGDQAVLPAPPVHTRKATPANERPQTHRPPVSLATGDCRTEQTEQVDRSQKCDR